MTKEKTHTHILIREIISSINSIDDGTEVFKKLSYQEKEKVIGFILNEMQEIVRKKFEKEKAESVKIGNMKLSIKKSKPRKMSQLYQVKYIAMEMAKRTNKQLVGKARKEFLDDWYDRVKKDIKRLKVPAVYAEHIATAKLNNIEIPENKKEKTTIIVNFSKDASTKK